MRVVARIPISMAPFVFRITRVPVIARPISVRRALPWVRSPIPTRVDSFLTTRPEFCRPMNAMKSPMPMVMDFLIVSGIALTSASRRLVTVRRNSISHSIRTAVSANC